MVPAENYISAGFHSNSKKMIDGFRQKNTACDCSYATFQKVTIGGKSRRNNKLVSKIISWAAGISLILAYGYGYVYNQIDFAGLIDQQLETLDTKSISPNIFKVQQNDHDEKYVAVGTQSGYGGPLVVGPIINEEGIIEQVLLLDNKETHSFIQKLSNRGFFKQFEGKHIRDPLMMNLDIDAVNGATISCDAITSAVHFSTHKLGEDHFGFQYEEPKETWEINSKDYAAIGVFLLAALALYSGKKWMRYLSLGVSMVFIGFYFNTAINVSQFGRVLLGFLPVFKSNVFWIVLVFGSIGYAFFFKKNIYCNAICPFHAVETIMIKIGGMKVKFTPQIQKIAKHSAKFLLWLALMIIFISRNPTLGSYEPFAMIFGLEGDGVQWYILPLVLIGVLLITDYFCRYFCPVGKGFGYIIKFRTWIDTQILSIKPLH